MARYVLTHAVLALALTLFTHAQQQCYFGPGAANRGPSELVPCMATGNSACCLLGDICLSGNTCWNYDTGNLYQYGCTDLTYKDESCPYKCGFNSTLSPWTALEYCVDQPGKINDTWVCHAPESCGCEWDPSPEMLVLQPRGCQDMGSDARVALYAPQALAPYLSLPKTFGGSTGYISTTTINGTSTWISTVISGYTPTKITQLTDYGPQPTQAVFIDAKAKPSASTFPAAASVTATSSSPSSSTPSETSPTTNTTTTTSTPTPKSALSTAAKAGIGAGIAAFVLLTTIIILLLLLLRRKRRTATPQPQPPPQNQPYAFSSTAATNTTTSASPYFPQTEKDAWQASAYPSSSPPMMSPHYDPTFHQGGYTSHVVPSLYSDQRSQKPPSVEMSPPPPMPPMELEGGGRVHELQGERVGREGEVGEGDGKK